eukprot:s1717_g8.t1
MVETCSSTSEIRFIQRFNRYLIPPRTYPESSGSQQKLKGMHEPFSFPGSETPLWVSLKTADLGTALSLVLAMFGNSENRRGH